MNSFSEPGVQCSQKLNLKKVQEEKPFWLGSTKMSSSKAEGTRQTSAAIIFLTAFLAFFRLIWVRLEAA
jgi:hypothetical protein